MAVKFVRLTVPANNATTEWVVIDPTIKGVVEITFTTGGQYTRLVTNAANLTEARAESTANRVAAVPSGAGGTRIVCDPSLTWCSSESATGAYFLYGAISS